MKTEDVQKKLNKLNDGVRRCRKCPLCKSRENAVPGEGPVNAKIFFLGEAPGKEEDLCGRPFIGRSGKFFEDMLTSIGLLREDVFITSSVKCRPPKNRTPHKNELEICKKNWLNEQIFLLNPAIIVLLGKTALKQFLGREDSLMKLHGQIIQLDGTKCLVTFHPASAMRFPKIRKEMKLDFKKLKKLTRFFDSASLRSE